MWLGERGSLAFKIGGDGKEVHLRQKRKQAYPERKVLLACMPSAKGCGGQSPTWRFDLSPLLLYGIIVQFLQTIRRTQWSRGWMKVRRKGIKRSHRHKKSANVPNSYYLEHLPRHPSAIPLYGEAERFVCWLRLKREQPKPKRGNKSTLPPLFVLILKVL